MGAEGTAHAGRALIVTISSTLLVCIIRFLLDPFLEDNAPFLLFYAAILFSAWYGGWIYGAISTIGSVFLSIFLFIEPKEQFSLGDLPDLLSLIMQVFTSSLGIFLIEELRRTQQNAREEAAIRKKAEDALRQSEASLLDAQGKLRSHADELEKQVAKRTADLTQSLRFMEEFLYSMAHDLRAPVRAVKGFTDALVQDYAEHLDETAKDYGRRIDLACERMDRLIIELLEYGRLSHTAMEIKPVPLRPLIEQVIREFEEEIRQSNAQVEVDVASQTVNTNEIALRQILRNLLSNSLKFIPPNRTPVIRIRSEQMDATIQICVEDNGIGIPAEHIAQIFKPFHRLHPQDQFPGVGMGLAIARLAAERMESKLTVSSIPGAGSRFCLELKKTPFSPGSVGHGG